MYLVHLLTHVYCLQLFEDDLNFHHQHLKHEKFPDIFYRIRITFILMIDLHNELKITQFLHSIL